MENQSDDREGREIAEAVRAACLKTAQHAYRDAAMRGLCKEGAWENALEAIRSMNVDEIIDTIDETSSEG